MEVELITTAIATVGFPIFIATYVVMRVEKTVKGNTDVITEMTTLIRERLPRAV